MGGEPAGAEAAAAWSAELGRLGGLVAHEINNLLNGVSVNLEVVRSRAARDAPGSAVAPFADSATSQLEALTPVIRGLVALTRPTAGDLSLVLEIGHISSVLGAVARARGGAVEVDVAGADTAICVAGATARLLLASAMRPAAEAGARARCTLNFADGEAVVRMARNDGIGVTLSSEGVRFAAAAGVRVHASDDALLLRFPAGSLHPSPT